MGYQDDMADAAEGTLAMVHVEIQEDLMQAWLVVKAGGRWYLGSEAGDRLDVDYVHRYEPLALESQSFPLSPGKVVIFPPSETPSLWFVDKGAITRLDDFANAPGGDLDHRGEALALALVTHAKRVLEREI